MNEHEEVAPALSHSEFLRIAFAALSVRSARWVTLLLSFALFAYDVIDPAWPRLAGATVFTLLVHCPLWFKKETRNGP